MSVSPARMCVHHLRARYLHRSEEGYESELWFSVKAKVLNLWAPSLQPEGFSCSGEIYFKCGRHLLVAAQIKGIEEGSFAL